MPQIALNKQGGKAAPTFVAMPDNMRGDLAVIARRRKTSVSRVIREAVAEYLDQHTEEVLARAS
jgi:predicted transcriptional regulator